ncbi:nucleotide-binding universal stress UspA family protein [Actinoalloteichus hoggarensis]|uniref:Universal stress protein n=1 Tax=Actinoalloteichus hoggarensis TaxID=1470176 RepID=A0A221W1S0_9PSEU|nr:universal stress protein [Actinoalloteichus hoggarensis]ASO19613.1 Universal stress protein [Actinoalloteichus hoggarensis]MBB5919680.1 nucleotide-binding universal stress UspA family protein [Actinoalloteichus hoggarensis]
MNETREDIVVGVDDSEASVAALIWAIQEARRRDSRVHALHAWRREPLAEFAFTEPEAAVSESATLLNRQIAKAREREGDDVEVVPRAVPGTPAAVLLGAAADGELLVVGSHRGGFLREMLLGSCSAAVVRHAHTPVVVIPPPGRDRQTNATAARDPSAGP